MIYNNFVVERFDRFDDLKLNREIFSRFAKLIKEKSGILFDLSKMYFLEVRLKKRMRERGIKNFLDYLILLESDYSDREFKELLNEITVQETSFFRINPHFKTLCDYVMPDLISRKRNSDAGFISFLSAGCSSGQEAYSIAFSVFESKKPFPPHWDFSVLGIDISTKAIEKARLGIYDFSEISRLPDRIVARFFDETEKGFKVKDFVKNKVIFKYANLLREEDLLLSGNFDVIFCRYVLIYLEESARKQVIDNLFKILNPGGFLFVAPSESYNVSDRFARVIYGDSVLFQKPF